MIYSKRFERKYIINFQTYEMVKNYMKKYFSPDKNGDNGVYRVTSLYYDSPDFRAYREKVDGEKKRSKVRLRVYQDLKGNYLNPTNKKVLLEIKKRDNLNVFKKKSLMSQNEAKEFIKKPVLHKNIINNGVDSLTEVAYLRTLYNIRPIVIVSYIREAFTNKFGPEVRITFDKCVKYRDANFDVQEAKCKNYSLDPRLIIMEIKYNELLPVWISKLIGKYSLILNTFGKYSVSVEKMINKREDFINNISC